MTATVTCCLTLASSAPSSPPYLSPGFIRQCRLEFRDAILGRDFRKLFPLIEEMPTGFDCSTLRFDEESNNNNHDDDIEMAEGANDGEGGGGAMVAGGGAGNINRGGIAGNGNPADVVVDGEGTGAAGMATAREWEEDVGGFWLKRISPRAAGLAGAVLSGRTAPKECDLAVEVGRAVRVYGVSVYEWWYCISIVLV